MGKQDDGGDDDETVFKLLLKQHTVCKLDRIGQSQCYILSNVNLCVSSYLD